MKKELTKVSAKDLTNKGSRFNNIITKAADINSLTFKTLDEKALQNISDWMPEVNRATNAFNKQNSQTTSSLMTLNMIDFGPYRILRQILAQVEKKRSALKENIYQLEKKKLKYQELKEKVLHVHSDLEEKRIQLKMNKIASDIVDANGHIEAALKELGAYKQRYEEVCKNNDIPDQWDEADFEAAEVEHHIKSMFRNAIRDRMQGSHNMGTMEYMEQFGINPITAYTNVDVYLHNIRTNIQEHGQGPDIEEHYKFLDEMYEMFKDEYKKAMARLGLDNITCAEFLMKESK